MHNKFFIIDDKILGTGSLNWTSTAMQINYENLIIIKDDQAVKNYSNYFYDLWKNAT